MASSCGKTHNKNLASSSGRLRVSPPVHRANTYKFLHCEMIAVLVSFIYLFRVALGRRDILVTLADSIRLGFMPNIHVGFIVLCYRIFKIGVDYLI